MDFESPEVHLRKCASVFLKLRVFLGQMCGSLGKNTGLNQTIKPYLQLAALTCQLGAEPIPNSVP